MCQLCQTAAVKGEDASQNPDGDAGHGPAATLFKIELAFEGVVARLEALPYRAEQTSAGACRFATVTDF